MGGDGRAGVEYTGGLRSGAHHPGSLGGPARGKINPALWRWSSGGEDCEGIDGSVKESDKW